MMNKKIVYPVLILSFVCVMFSSCTKTIEKEPLSNPWWTEDYIFDPTDSLGTYLKNFLSDIYGDIPGRMWTRIGGYYNGVSSSGSIYGGDMLDVGAGEAIPSRLNTPAEKFLNGQFSPYSSGIVDDYWSQGYTSIRKVNIYLANFDIVPLKNQTDKIWKHEARFLRALFYFELVKRYGGVPLIGDKIFSKDDNMDLPRNSFKACVDYIVSECDYLKDSLRPEIVSDADWGRIGRNTALALKARVLLYAASPLFNDPNNGITDTLFGYTNYDLNRWKLAADAADSIIVSGKHTLYSSFMNLFLTRKTTEVIYAYQMPNNTYIDQYNNPIGYQGSASMNAYGYTSPTQEMVDAFQMKNGKDITDPTSGYDPNNPYVNRDPRLDLTIFYNGLKWFNRPIETYEGGRDKPGGTVRQTRTGYYLRKFLGNFTSSTQYTSGVRNVILFRYAEILLNYAEAKNEYSGPDASVYKAVEDIRQRAGLNPYKLPVGLNRDQMSEVIRQERRVELAFEEHRFWDIRRWKIAKQILNSPLHGMKITNNGGTLTYQVVEVLKPVFADKQYLYPIPYAEWIKYTKVRQNPGWQ